MSSISATTVRLAVLAALLSPGPAAAQAQQEPPGPAAESLDEIVVTAQRRAESLQTVPVAVSAFTEAQLESRQVSSAIDLVRMVPNLLGQNNAGTATANTYFMRGLGSTEQIALLDPPVSTYVDDVIIPRQNANNYAMFDVERVEVLRGPQGTTFGRNSTGGAVNVITKKPGTQRAGSVTLGGGNYGHRFIRGSADLPLTDRVLTKLSAFYDDDDGWLHDLTHDTMLNAFENWGVRAALRYLASDSVTWDLSAEYMVANGPYLRSIFGTGRDTRTSLETGGATSDVVADMLARRGLRNDTSAVGVTSNLEWTRGETTLNAITGYRSNLQKFVLDFSLPTATVTPSPFFLNNAGRYDSFTQEFKMTGTLGSSIKYVGGFFFFYEDNFTKAGQATGALTGPLTLTCSAGLFGDGQIVCPNGVRGYSSFRDIRNTTTSYALYAQADYQISDRFTLVAGGRYTEEEKKIDLKSTGYGGMTTADLIAAGIDTKLDTGEFTPKLGIEFQASNDVMLFASATRGFKAGGWNSRTAYIPQTFEPMTPEKTTSYEVGIKSELFDRRLRLNVGAFLAETDDLQLNYTTPGPIPGTALSTQANAGDVEIRGIELELTAQLGRNLEVFGSAGFQSGEFKSVDPGARSFCTNGGAVVNGACSRPGGLPTAYINAIDIDDEPSRLPKRTLAAGFSWEIPAPVLSGGVRLSGEVNYVGGYWTTGSNSRPDLRLIPSGPLVTPTALDSYARSYTLWSVSVGYESDDGHWRASLGCRNCSDESYITSTFNGGYYGEPRRVDGSITYRF